MVCGLGTRGQVASSGDTRRDSPGLGTRDTCRTRRLPGEVSLAGLAAHSGASGRVLCMGTRDTCRFPKLSPKGGVRKEVSKGWLPGWLSGHPAFSEGLRKGVTKGFRGDFRDTWHSPRVSDGGFEGAFGRASGWLRKGFWEHVSYSERLRKGSFGVARPEGVFEGGFEGGLPEGLFRRGFRKACSGGRPWSLD